MADLKISALTAATTPLAGTEVLPIVQSGATVKVSVDNLTTGKAVSGTQFTASTGNFIVGTAGKGVDFSANTHAAGMTSELLTWYEEGTWTPALTFSVPGDLAVTYSVQVGRYTRIGRQVFITGDVETSAFTHTTASGTLRMSGLPFASANVTGLLHAGSCSAAGYTATANMVTPLIQNNVSFIIFQISYTGSAVANLTTANIPSGTQQVWRVSASYVV